MPSDTRPEENKVIENNDFVMRWKNFSWLVGGSNP